MQKNSGPEPVVNWTMTKIYLSDLLDSDNSVRMLLHLTSLSAVMDVTTLANVISWTKDTFCEQFSQWTPYIGLMSLWNIWIKDDHQVCLLCFVGILCPSRGSESMWQTDLCPKSSWRALHSPWPLHARSSIPSASKRHCPFMPCRCAWPWTSAKTWGISLCGEWGQCRQVSPTGVHIGICDVWWLLHWSHSTRAILTLCTSITCLLFKLCQFLCINAWQ